MSDLDVLLRGLNVFTWGLVVGSLVVFQITMLPILLSWPAELSARLHTTITRWDPDYYIRPLAAIALFSAVLVLIVGDNVPDRSVALTIGGLVLQVGIAIIAETINRPINRVIRDADDAPSDHAALIARWGRWHLIRTVFGVVSLACYVLAALWGA